MLDTPKSYRELWGNEASDAVLAYWTESIVPRLSPKASRKLTGADVVRLFKVNFFDGELTVGTWYENSELIALALLMRRHGLDFPEEMQMKLGRAIALELLSHALKDWKSPDKRKRALLKFSEDVGISENLGLITGELADEQSRVEKPTDLLVKVESWLRSEDRLGNEYPDFLRLLDRIVRANSGFEFDERFQSQVKTRMGMLAFYVGWWLELGPDEVRGMVERAVKKDYLL